ncbi:hypothetical protein CIK05_11925 [Bdellovibrio sp. qaytius]|nr:hypothetical protein CIK05_11925 [Bdellovibrio sp. qaytius]
MVNKFLLGLCSIFISAAAFAGASGKYFDRVVYVVFENENYVAAIKGPFFTKLAKGGAAFTSFTAVTHPSQGNYVAMTSGAQNGVTGDSKYDINVKHIADLLEARGLTWKVYAENYPGNCFVGTKNGTYRRKHNPFISYVNIQKDKKRCANIVNATQMDKDIAANTLPNYVFYVPDMNNDGHDTNVDYSDKWYNKRFSGFLTNPNFMDNTLLISTYDENGGATGNQIYTSFYGPMVKPGTVVADKLNHYSLMKLIEENWDLGNLGKNDATAKAIPASVWR